MRSSLLSLTSCLFARKRCRMPMIFRRITRALFALCTAAAGRGISERRIEVTAIQGDRL